MRQTSFGFWALALLAPAVSWAVPIQLGWQARLLDAAGDSVEGPVSLQVDLTDGASGPVVHTETFDLTAERGFVSLRLGAGSTTLDHAKLLSGDVWVSAQVNGEVVAPPTLLVSVPYAAVAYSVSGGSVAASEVVVDDGGEVVLGLVTGETCTRAGALVWDGARVRVCNGTTYVAVGDVRRVTLASGARRWSDGSVATTCEDYRRPGSPLYIYEGDVGSGLYIIDPKQNGAGLQVFCDQDSDDGGWTLIGKVHRFHSGTAYDEPRGWLGLSRDTAALVNATSYEARAPGQSAHGSAALGDVWTWASLSRFVVIAENDTAQRMRWYKAVDSGVWNWFSATDHAATMVCNNVAMTAGCSTGKILSSGDSTNMTNMDSSDWGYAGGVMHMRLNGDTSASRSAICSSTSDNNGNAWHDSNSGHWGNGLEIWVR